MMIKKYNKNRAFSQINIVYNMVIKKYNKIILYTFCFK